MKVNVAGAGAGKTTKMADLIMDYEIPDGKVIFCIAFTNAAADNIRKKVVKKVGEIPNNIKISTIHSFLYQELVKPYYYFLYNMHYERLSIIPLSEKHTYKAVKLSELEKLNILHFTKIPEKAKWVVDKKSGDTKSIKEIRQKILLRFKSYCAAIFVDEAQDISKDIKAILIALDEVGVEINLYGDPKQDIKGAGCFREIIDNTQDVVYIPTCHRCPQIHLNLSNLLAPASEKQIADEKNAAGSISIDFESHIEDIKEYIDSGDYGLKYISAKHGRYDTHSKNETNERFNTLQYEINRAINDKWQGQKIESEISRKAFYIAEKMLKNYDTYKNAHAIIYSWVGKGAFDRLSKQRYAQMIEALKAKKAIPTDTVVVSSIEIIKGIDAKRCLFILTSDLAPYLFQTKTEDNKMRHLLYVALTRSLDHLTILITREVEEAYERTFIIDYFKQHKIL